MTAVPEALRCSVCIKVMRDPCTLLPCQHTACFECLFELQREPYTVFAECTAEAHRQCCVCKEICEAFELPAWNPDLRDACRQLASQTSFQAPAIATMADYDDLAVLAGWTPTKLGYPIRFKNVDRVRAVRENGLMVTMNAAVKERDRAEAALGAAQQAFQASLAKCGSAANRLIEFWNAAA